MSVVDRWTAIVNESGSVLPPQLKPFQMDTQTLLEAGRHTLVAAATGAGKSLVQLNGSRVMGGCINSIVILLYLLLRWSCGPRHFPNNSD